MKTQTVNPTVKKRTVKRKHSDSFKGKLRGNIGKVIGLKEPQLLVKFGVEDVVPSKLVKSIIATSANKKTADLGKNIITSTPHYTKNKDNFFFNNTGSTVFSPINYKENEEKEHVGNVSSDSEILSPGQQGNSSVIYVCTRDGDGNALSNVPHELSGKTQDKLVSNAKDAPNNPLKRISVGEPPSEPPITKKSKIPVRTASQEREDVEHNYFLLQTRSKHKNIPKSTLNVTDTSQERNRPVAKERRSSSVPAKTPEQQRKYSTRVSKSSQRHSPEKLADPPGPQQNVSASKDPPTIERSARSDNVDSKTNNNNNNDDGGEQNRNESNVTSRRGRKRRNQNNNFTDTEHDKSKNQKSDFAKNIGLSPVTGNITDRSERANLDRGKVDVSANDDVVNSPRSTRSRDRTRKLPTKDAPLNPELTEEIKTKKNTLEEGKSRGIVNKEIQTSIASNDAAVAATTSIATQPTKQNKRKNATSANNNSEQLLPERTGRAPSAHRKPRNHDTSLDNSLIDETKSKKAALEAKKARIFESREIQTSVLSNDEPATLNANITDRSERAKLDKGKDDVSANDDVVNSPRSARLRDRTRKLPTKEAPFNPELTDEIKMKKNTLEESKSRGIVNKEIQASIASNDAAVAVTTSNTTQPTKPNKRKNAISANNNSEQLLPEMTGRVPSDHRMPRNHDTSLDNNLIEETKSKKFALEAKKARNFENRQIQTSFLSNDDPVTLIAKITDRSERAKLDKGKDDVSANDDVVNSPRSAISRICTRKLPTKEAPLNLELTEKIKTKKNTLEECKSRGIVNKEIQTSIASNDAAVAVTTSNTTQPTKQNKRKNATSANNNSEQLLPERTGRAPSAHRKPGIVNKESHASIASNDTAVAVTTSNTTQPTKQNKRKNATSANNNSEQLPERTGRAPSAHRELSNHDTSSLDNIIEQIKLKKAALEAKKARSFENRQIQTSGLSNDDHATLNETINKSDVSKINQSESYSDLSSFIEERKSRNTDLQKKGNAHRTVSPVKKGPVTKKALSETMSLGHILSQRGMVDKMKKWEEFCARLEGLFRSSDGSIKEGENSTSSITSKNRRFSKCVESPKNMTKKISRRGAVFGFIASSKRRRSLSLTVSVPPEEKTENLHDLIGKIKSTITKTKKSRQTVNKEIQTIPLEQGIRKSVAPLFKRSSVRKGLERRSCGTMLEFGDSTSSSENHTYEGPNIYDSLKEGNPLDDLDFSDLDGPNLTPLQKPWRFEDTNNSAQSDIALNFLRPESLIRYSALKSPRSSNIVPRKTSLSSSDESDLSPNNRTLTENDVSRGSTSRTSPRKRYRQSRRDLRRYDKRNKELLKPALTFPSEKITRVSKSSEKVNSRISVHNNDAAENIDTSRKTVNRRAETTSSNFDEAHRTVSEAGHFEENNSKQVSEETSGQKTGELRNYARNTLRQSKKIETGASNQAETNNGSRRVSPSAKKGTTSEPQPTNRQSTSITRRSMALRKDIDEPTVVELNNESVPIRSSVSNEQMPALTQSPGKRTTSLETDTKQYNRLNGSRTVPPSAKKGTTTEPQPVNRESRSITRRSKAGRKDIDEPAVVDSNNASVPIRSSVSNEQSPEKRTPALETDTRQYNRLSDISGTGPLPATPLAKGSGKDNIISTEASAKHHSRSKSRKKGSEKNPALGSNISVLNMNELSKTLNNITGTQDGGAIGNRRLTLKSKSNNQSNRSQRTSTKQNDQDENEASEPPTINDQLPEQAAGSVAPAAGAENKKGRAKQSTVRKTRSTRFCLGDVSDFNILTSKDGQRPQRTRKPVKYHTDIDIEARGYILVSSVRTNRSKKGGNTTMVKRTKKSTKETNPQLVTDVLEPPIAEEYEENRTDQDNIANPALELCDNLRVEITPLPTTYTSTNPRGRKRLVTDSRVESSIPNESNKKRRSDTSQIGAGHVNMDVDSSVLGSNLEHANSELQPVDDSQMLIMPPPRVATVGKSRSRRGRKKRAVDSGYENSDSEECSNKGRSNSNSRNTRHNKDSASLARELRSSVEPSISGESQRLDEQNALHDFMDRGSGLLDRASNLSSALRPIAATLEMNNETDFDKVGRRTSPPIDDDFVRSIDDGQVYNLRYISRPPESSFTKMGNLYISETTVDPKGRYSAGFLRLDLEGQKKPGFAYIYSFIYVVVSGTAHIQLEDRNSIVNQGEFFHIPRDGLCNQVIARTCRKFNETYPALQQMNKRTFARIQKSVADYGSKRKPSLPKP